MMFGKARLHLVALIAATAFLLLWPGQPAGAQSFWPQVHVELDGYWVDNDENIYIDSRLDANDVMYDAWVQFTPPEWFVAADATVPDGAEVGDISTDFHLGLLNGPCSTQLPIDFRMLDCTTSTGDTVSLDDGFNDADANGLPDACDKYPDFLNTLFPGITARARYYGQASVAGAPTSLNLVIFEPGETLPDLPAFDPGWGYPSITVLNDPTGSPAPGSLTDVCTDWSRGDNFWPRSNDNPDTFDNEDGYLLRQNPGDWGNYNFMAFARGRPDADNDGIENDLDTCPFDQDWDENPRDGNGPDGDGLDSACDPEWDVYNPDQDDDGYLNRGDNCPLVPNGLSEDNQADADGDGIGDACDTLDKGNGPDVVDGFQPETWFGFGVEVTGDSDMDGWSDALEHIAGSDDSWDLSTPEGLWRTPWTCADDVDNDLDGLKDGYDLGCDWDGDGVANVFDACLDQPEDWDGFEDADGCPDNDNDMDGVWDWDEGCIDFDDDDWCDMECLNIPEDFDSYQDWDGCPDADNDNDGFPDVTDDCPATDWTAGPDGIADSGDEPHDVWGIPIQTREDYDGIIDWDGCHDSPGDDYDLDGFSDEVEFYIGTDPIDDCPDEPGDLDAWPYDNNMDTWSNVMDVLQYKGHLQIPASDPGYVQRLDINADEWVNVMDVLRYKDHLQIQCTSP